MTPVLLLAFLFFFTQSPNASAPAPSRTASKVDAAWSVLHEGLDNKNSDKRSKAVHSLGLAPNNNKIEGIAEKALTDENVEVRVQAANALGQIGADPSRPKLKEALKDPDLKVVIASANALYAMKDPAAYDVYYALLTGERKGPGLVKSQLDTLKDRKQLEELMFQAGMGFVPFGGMGLEAWKTITRDDTSAIRAVAAERLAADPDPKTTEALSKGCFDKKWRVRVGVVEAIAKRHDPALLQSVSELLYDENDTVRYEAAAAVIAITTPGSPAAPQNKRRSSIPGN